MVETEFKNAGLEVENLLKMIQDVHTKGTQIILDRVAQMGDNPQQLRNLINTVTLMCIN